MAGTLSTATVIPCICKFSTTVFYFNLITYYYLMSDTTTNTYIYLA